MSDYKLFIDKMHRLIGVDLTLYKEAQMRRRLTSLRNKLGYDTFNQYYDALQADKQLLQQFIDRITINVTEFYRNPKRWEVLRNTVFPELTKNKASLHIWSAACSTGEEPYSIAIMLKEHFPHVQVTITATDIDERVLEKAKIGAYVEIQLKDLPRFKKSKYFTFKNNKYYVDESLKSSITFKRHDLLKDPYPSRVDLIVCRNVLIYFTDPAKEKIYDKFSKSLQKDGFLFVGSTEQIFNPEKHGLTLFDTFFYRKQ